MAIDLRQTEQYIRQAAQKRGIDPDIAVRVARSEGLDEGVWQSNIRGPRGREPSYGPFQLLVGGGETGFPAGMGNEFIEQTGLDPKNPETVNAQVDFALDRAAKTGWQPWYGAGHAGIDRWEGVRGASPAGVDTDRGMASLSAGRGSRDTGLAGFGAGASQQQEERPRMGRARLTRMTDLGVQGSFEPIPLHREDEDAPLARPVEQSRRDDEREAGAAERDAPREGQDRRDTRDAPQQRGMQVFEQYMDLAERLAEERRRDQKKTSQRRRRTARA